MLGELGVLEIGSVREVHCACVVVCGWCWSIFKLS